MKRLYKSRTDRVIAGVCGGVGEYFEIDPVLIRIIWVVLSLLGGSGIIAYIIGIIIIPEAPETVEAGEDVEEKKPSRATNQTVWGIILITIGLVVLLSQFDIFRYFSHRFWYISWGVIFPVFLIILGAVVLFRRRPADKAETEEDAARDYFDLSGLVRLRRERKLAGVCAGVAYYLKIDPTIVRLLWVIGIFATGGIAVLLYIILAIIMPESDATFEDAAEPE
ncbi:MAG TPA: PspC domain-containing protein [bacterium]|nr:PspC domain-containing protein [bacterium]